MSKFLGAEGFFQKALSMVSPESLLKGMQPKSPPVPEKSNLGKAASNTLKK